MPKLDDDEGDEKSAYAANKRLSGGGGGTDDDDGDGEDDLLSPVVRSFCHHVVSSKFRKELDAFFGARCDGFEEADAEGEQLLEWTETFQEYVAKVAGGV